MNEVVVLTKADLADMISHTARLAVEEAIRRMPAKNTARPLHVNQKQAAEMLGLSHVTVAKMVKAGTLKLNACGLIPIEQVDAAAAVSRAAL